MAIRPAAILNFTPIDRGDTFDQIIGLNISIDGNPVDLNDAQKICWQVRRFPNTALIFEIPVYVANTTDGANGDLKVDSFIAEYPAFTYEHDLHIITKTGFSLHYVRGVLPINETISKC